MNPRTFLPARRLQTRPSPVPGDAARELPIRLQPGRAAVVAFLRHTGCPFAEATMRALREQAAAAPEHEWIAVSHAPRAATDRWCESLGGPGDVRLLSDPSRHTYAAWGLGQTTLGHFLGRRSLQGVVALQRNGIRNTHPNGTRWQSAGTFALDGDAVVRWRHLPTHAGDLPDLRVALLALR
jgi:AhpC/TSA family